MAPAALYRGSARVMRGFILGLCCTLLSAAAHTAGGGGAIDGGLLLSLAVATGLGVAWADRRGTWVRLAAFVIGCQVLLHVVASLAGAHHLGQSLLPAPSMLLAHVIAAVILALLLAHADTLIHRWVRFLRSLTARPVLLQSIPGQANLRVPGTAVASRATRTPALLMARRGPPSAP